MLDQMQFDCSYAMYTNRPRNLYSKRQNYFDFQSD